MLSSQWFVVDAPQNIHKESMYNDPNTIAVLMKKLKTPPSTSPPPILFPSLFLQSLSFSSPSLLLSLSVFLQRLPAFKHHTPFLPTGPPPQAHEESEQQVSLSVNAWIYDFLFDLSSSFPSFISEWDFQLSLKASKQWLLLQQRTKE